MVVSRQTNRADVNATFLQPFVWYQFGRGETVFLHTESTYDWTGEQWIVPINVGYIKVFALGTQPASIQLMGRYFVEAPAGGPTGACASRSRCCFRARRFRNGWRSG